MTTVAGTSRRSSAARVRQRLVLTWSISPQAVVGAGLATACEMAQLEVEGPLPGGEGAMAARLVVDGHTRHLESSAAVIWAPDAESGLVHLDVPEILHATAAVAPPRVLYARTRLLARLGLGGGRYEFEGGRLC